MNRMDRNGIGGRGTVEERERRPRDRLERDRRQGRQDRLRDRTRGGRDAPPPRPAFAPEDVAAFVVIDETTNTLLEEITALATGDVETVVSMTSRKEALTARLENLRPRIDEYVRATGDADIKDRLRRLADAVEKNQAYLERMVEAVRRIAKEYRKIDEKNRTMGIYGPRGRKVNHLLPRANEVDGAF